MSNVAIVAGAAAITLYVVADGDEASLPQSTPPTTQGPSSAPTPYASPQYQKPVIVEAIKAGTATTEQKAIAKAGALGGLFGGGRKPAGGADLLSGTLTKEQIKNLTKEKVAELEKRAAEEYKKLSSSAKKAGAEYLNKELGIQPPLTGTESWKDVSKVVGGAVGAAAGGAACAPIGLTAVCAPLGAMLGAYLGPKVGKWLSDTWDSVEDWAGKLYGDVKGGIKKIIPFW